MAKKWWEKRMYGVHYTLREIDAKNFNTERFISETVELGFNLISFDSSGYHTLYPTALPLNRKGPYIEDRDIIGEIMSASRKAGLTTQLCIDVGKGGTHEVFLNRPEWVVRDVNGEPMLWTTQHGNLYVACTFGGYLEGLLYPVIQEQLSRYKPDAMLLTDFSQPVCYCGACRRRFMEDEGLDIPKVPNRADQAWQTYIRWRYRTLANAWKQATEFCHSVTPDVKVVMNTVATFNDQIIQQGLSFDLTRDSADLIETEAQTRISFTSLDDGVTYQNPFWPTEQIRWLGAATKRAVVDHCSYFYAWPWRRTAITSAYQKMWLLQVAVNGGHPILHYVGPVYAQEDQRGSDAIRETGNILKQHEAVFDDTESAADVAVVFSQETLDFRGDSAFPHAYEQHMRGALWALAGIPYDILTSHNLAEVRLEKYKVIVLPSVACMSEEMASMLSDWVRKGGGLVAIGETSLYHPDGKKRQNFLMSDLFGCDYTGTDILPIPNLNSRSAHNTNYYMTLNGQHSLLQGIEKTSVILCAGSLCVVSRRKGTETPLSVLPPYEIFPEGRAYPVVERTEIPAAITHEVANGRVVYFPSGLDRLSWLVRHPDLTRLIRNAVAWTGRDKLSFELSRPRSVILTARFQAKEQRYLLHLINGTGSFPYEEIPPVENLTVRLRLPASARNANGFRTLITPQGVTVKELGDGVKEIHLQRLESYEIVAIEGA